MDGSEHIHTCIRRGMDRQRGRHLGAVGSASALGFGCWGARSWAMRALAWAWGPCARTGPKERDRPRNGPCGLGFVRRSGPREEVGFGWAVGEAKAVWAEGAGGLLVRKLDQIRFEPNLEYGRLRIKYRKVEIDRTKPKPNSIRF